MNISMVDDQAYCPMDAFVPVYLHAYITMYMPTSPVARFHDEQSSISLINGRCDELRGCKVMLNDQHVRMTFRSWFNADFHALVTSGNMDTGFYYLGQSATYTWRYLYPPPFVVPFLPPGARARRAARARSRPLPVG